MVFSEEARDSYLYLLKWIVIAAVAGLFGGALLQAFRTALVYGSEALRATAVPPPVWAVGAALVVGGIFYRIEPDSAGEGIPSYLMYLNQKDNSFPAKATAWKLPSALVTLIGFGSGGIVGPVGRVSAGVLSTVAGVFAGHGLTRDDHRTAAICGMAAVVGATFHAPIGGGVFAVEIIQKANMRYRDLFPSILSSAVAVWLSQAAGWRPVVVLGNGSSGGFIANPLMILVLSLILGLLGGAFTRFYSLVVRLFRRNRGNLLPKVVAGMAVSSLVAWLINPELLGPALSVFAAIIDGNTGAVLGRIPAGVPVVLGLCAIAVTRGFCNCVTTGSGMSAGFVGPLALIGMLVGYTAAYVLGVPHPSPLSFGLIAAGFSGLLAGSMNVPVAAAIMTIEVFGVGHSLSAGVAAIVGFQTNRHRTVYDYALAGSGRDEADGGAAGESAVNP